jgi:hypothetical protein
VLVLERSHLNREYSLLNVLKALASNISMSIQCKISLRGPKSMRKVDGLNLIFIVFYVPALASHLNSIQTLLQLRT